MLRGLVVDPERGPDLRGVPRLAVIVRDHEPEAAKLFRGNGDAELRDVAGEKGADELLPPVQARLVGVTQERLRKPATKPERVEAVETDFGAVEATQVDKPHPARQRLRHALDQVERGAAQDEKAGRRARAIRQDAQQREQVGPALDLVDDDEPGERAERLPRCVQAGQVQGIFEIEVGVWPGRQIPGQGRLAALAWAEQRGDTKRARDC